MIQFAAVFPDEPIVATLSQQLSGPHFKGIIPFDDRLQREFYAKKCRLDSLSLHSGFSEKDLESALVREMEWILLELGTGFSFVARQKRMTVDDEDFSPDLLFYHRKMHRPAAIDLNLGKLTASYVGQMRPSLRWLDREMGRVVAAPANSSHSAACEEKKEEGL